MWVLNKQMYLSRGLQKAVNRYHRIRAASNKIFSCATNIKKKQNPITINLVIKSCVFKVIFICAKNELDVPSSNIQWHLFFHKSSGKALMHAFSNPIGKKQNKVGSFAMIGQLI